MWPVNCPRNTESNKGGFANGNNEPADIHRQAATEEVALCFGWIDSTLKKLPDGRLAQRLSPRRKGSHWTELNKQRCRDLERQGLMTDFGMKELHESNEKKHGNKETDSSREETVQQS